MIYHSHPATFIDHIHLKVRNLSRSLEFYQDVLGFQIIEQQSHIAKLSAGGVDPLITLEQPGKVTPLNPRETGLFHVAYLLPSRSDLANVLRHLLHIGYPLAGASDHLVSEALYLADPDGNGIEIYADRDKETWDWKNNEVVMSTLPLNADNLLKEVDNDGWLGIPVKTIIGHVHLQVNELEKAKHFYMDGFGFDLVSKYGNQAVFLSSAGYHHHIGLNVWNSAGGKAPAETSVGLKNYSLSIPNRERKPIKDQLMKCGYKVEKVGNNYCSKDPSGNIVYF